VNGRLHIFATNKPLGTKTQLPAQYFRQPRTLVHLVYLDLQPVYVDVDGVSWREMKYTALIISHLVQS